ncbi:RNA-dependent RNA polymerase [Taro-associated totivirus L]|nr:RNA-dependent RNA polymerase [Taro-associated totivirus L]
MGAILKRNMSVAYSLVDGYQYGDIDGTSYLRREFNVDRMAIAHAEILESIPTNAFPRAAVSSEHHTHYKPEEVYELAKKYQLSRRAISLVYKKLLKIEGVTEACASTFFIYLLYARPQVAYLIACSRELWQCTHIDELNKTLKRLSTPLKSMQCSPYSDFTELFELQSLVNRGIGKVDWAGEKTDRTKPNVIEIDPGVVYKEALNIFKYGRQAGFRYKRMDINKYVQSRWEWVPTGSVHSQHKEDEEYIKKNYRHRTKFVTMNMMPAHKVRQLFSRPPEIHSWASVKYEWAKQRAIYGVDLTSSVITNFAMYRCEEVFKHRFPVGEDAAADRVHKRLTMMLKDNESFCYDFDNFNAQHSKRSMQMVLLAYYDAFKEFMMPEQEQAMEWVIKSVSKMVVHNYEVEPPDEYHAAGTLLSGWRLTTFINTALNFIYFKAAGAFDIVGVKDSVHNGDDVLVAVRNLKAAVLIHKAMADVNARAQATKCNVFSVGEFLRVEHKVTKEEGLGAQYLSRASATMAHSRTESQAPLRLTDAVKAMVTRAEEIAARAQYGAELTLDFVQHAVHRLAEIFSVPFEKAWLITEQHVVTGGAIESTNGKVDYLISEEPMYREWENTANEEEGLAKVKELMPGIKDYAVILNRQYGEYLPVSRIERKIINATERQLAITRGTRLLVTDVRNEQKYKYGRALFRMYRHIIDVPHVEKARFLGISPIALLDMSGITKIRKLVQDVTDVDYTLHVLL